MPFVVGAPRSGTTLLRFMLDAHPDLAIPPETGFLVPLAALAERGDFRRKDILEVITGFPQFAPAFTEFGIPRWRLRRAMKKAEPTVAEAVRCFYRLYAGRFGKRRFGDKTPLYGKHVASIASILPEAHFIHIVRDGRDVALSLRQTWFSPGPDMAILAAYWRDWVTATREGGASLSRYVEVRYEDLVRDPEPVLRRLTALIDLPFDAAMLRYHERVRDRQVEASDRIGKHGRIVVSRETRLGQTALTASPPQVSRAFAWRSSMDAEEERAFDAVAGPVLELLGYARSRGGSPT